MNWLNKHKVWIAGMIQFILTSLVELTSHETGDYSTYIIAYSAAVAALTYAGRNLRGQWASISGALLSSVMVFGGLHDSNIPLTFQVIAVRIVMPLSIAVMGIFFTSPPKSREYEHSQPIVEAKAEAKQIMDIKKGNV